MKVTVTGKHFDMGDSLRTHVAGMTSSIVERCFGKAIEAHAVLCRARRLAHGAISVPVLRGDLTLVYRRPDGRIGGIDPGLAERRGGTEKAK